MNLLQFDERHHAQQRGTNNLFTKNNFWLVETHAAISSHIFIIMQMINSSEKEEENNLLSADVNGKSR